MWVEHSYKQVKHAASRARRPISVIGFVMLPFDILLPKVAYGPCRRAVGSVGAAHPKASSPSRRSRKTLARPKGRSQRYLMDFTHRGSLERPAQALPSLPDLPSALPEVGRAGCALAHPRSVGRRPRRAGRVGPLRVLHRRHRCGCKKGGGVWQRPSGEGTKLMAIADGFSLPLAVHTASASPHEVSLVGKTWRMLCQLSSSTTSKKTGKRWLNRSASIFPLVP
jgi:hypothetical protein